MHELSPTFFMLEMYVLLSIVWWPFDIHLPTPAPTFSQEEEDIYVYAELLNENILLLWIIWLWLCSDAVFWDNIIIIRHLLLLSPKLLGYGQCWVIFLVFLSTMKESQKIIYR